ncbi:MAG: nitroreductase family protein [Tissierellales bacterium]
MIINFSVEEAVIKRYSVRNYKDINVEREVIDEIKRFVNSLSNPFGKRINYHFLEKEDVNNRQGLGTYGVIKGAKQYIGTTIELESMALEALGYELEVLMLYLAHRDIGTCWLGGTFDRKGFAQSMNIGKNEIFPAITPYGYAASSKHLKEIAMRKMIKADQRVKWDKIFFKDDFANPLRKEEAGSLQFPLEMVRLGPSASNKQPWRIVLTDNLYHFYQYKEPNYSALFPYDIQRIDMGIAAAHFDLAVKESGYKGKFDTKCDPGLKLPNHVEYAFTWLKD